MDIGFVPARKPLANCVPGELVRLTGAADSFFCFVLATLENEAVVAVLDDPDDMPYRDTWRFGDRECLSWGTDWFLEPIVGPETFIDNTDLTDRSGTLLLFPTSIGMWFQRNPTDPRSSGLLVDLENWNRLQQERHAGTPISSWKIWASRTDYDAVGRKPVLVFPPSTSPKR